MIKRATLRVRGRVQGVFYRAETRVQAVKLGLKGYARNNRDGTVTVVAVGDESDLQKLAAWCQKGPDFAKVENIETSYEEPKSDEEFSGFEIY